jgi:hypothetical protein
MLPKITQVNISTVQTAFLKGWAIIQMDFFNLLETPRACFIAKHS